MTKFWFKKKVTPGKVDTFPLSLTRHRVYILPTSYGFLFIGILFAMLLGSINYNNNLGFLLVFLLGSIMLVSMIHTYRNLLGIEILSVSARPVFAGKTAVFEFLVRSNTFHRRDVGFMLKKQKPTIENIVMQTDQPVAVKFSTRFRGISRPGRMTVWSRYPVGLFKAWTVVVPDVSCVIYPKPVGGPLGFSGEHGGDDTDGNSTRQGVDDFFGLKLYQPGDPVSKISWKSLSRGLGVFTKEFSGTGSISMMIDYDALGDAGMEHKLSRLTDMVLKAHNMNAEYGLKLPGRTISPDKGERHKHTCLKTLSVFGLSENE